MKKILIGLLVGLVSGLFSAGGSLILVPICVYLLKMEEKEARATTLFCILPMVIVTAIVYNKNDFLDLNLGLKCALGGIIGGLVGSKWLNKISNKILKLFFILFLFYASFSLLMR